jgi:hypothetical protein
MMYMYVSYTYMYHLWSLSYLGLQLKLVVDSITKVTFLYIIVLCMLGDFIIPVNLLSTSLGIELES